MKNETINMRTVPDSLDLVERAKLGLNGILGTVNPEIGYEPYFLTFFAARPAYMVHWSSLVSGVLPKYLEAVALLRNMSGDSKMREIEEGMKKSILENISEDGLIYDRKDPKRPWNVGVGYGIKSWNEDYANLGGNGRLVNAMYYHYQMTGDEMWKKQMKRTTEKMLEVAVFKDNFAYYPNVGCGNDFSYPIKSGWIHTNEPKGPQEGGEGATTFCLANPIRGLLKWYRLSGDERMLDLSARLARFVMLPRFYGAVVEMDPDYGARRTHWWGHFHGNTGVLRSIMEYAALAEDYRVMEFVRDGYEWARHNICPQLGLNYDLEGCATGDLIAIGIQLSDAGIGDFWDDVDYVVRNSLSEAQVTDRDALVRIGEASPERPKDAAWGAPFDWRFNTGILNKPLPGQECTDNVIDRSIGAFSWLIDGRFQKPVQMHCCTANGNQGFYYAWDAVVRYNKGTANINLLFNRLSPWLDLDSYLPYEGKVVIRNKTAENINIRIPSWAGRSRIRIRINDMEVNPLWAGLYAQFTGMKYGFKEAKDAITKMVNGENQGDLCYVVPLYNNDVQIPKYSFKNDRDDMEWLDISDLSAFLYKDLAFIKARKWGHDHGIPRLNPNIYGGEVIAQAFGSKYTANPCGTIRVINNLEDIPKLPEVTIYSQPFKNAYKIIEYFYNKTYGKIPIYMQHVTGPFSAAGLIVKEIALLEGIYANPDAVHWLLNKCTDLFIDFVKEQKKYAPNINIMYDSWWPEGLGVWCGDDSILHLSPKHFSEFIVPYYNRISDAFGGIVCHSCGKYSHLFSIMRDEIRNLRGIHFNAGDIDKAYEVFKGTNTVLIPATIVPGMVNNFKDRVEYIKYILKFKTPYHSMLLISSPFFDIDEPDQNTTSEIVLDILRHYKKQVVLD